MKTMRRRGLKDASASSPTDLLLSGRIPMVALVQTLAVAEHLNFRHAASALGVSSSSVSTRVKTLEEDLGVQLFVRHARGVRLTEAGRCFVARVAIGIDQIDDAVKTAGMAASGECGRIRVGVHALIPGSFLAELISRYREAHPGIAIEMTEGTARDAIMMLRADQLDIRRNHHRFPCRIFEAADRGGHAFSALQEHSNHGLLNGDEQLAWMQGSHYRKASNRGWSRTIRLGIGIGEPATTVE